MGLWDWLADWLEPTLPDIYRCGLCDRQFEEPRDVCPSCGGEVEEDAEIAFMYDGPL